MLYRTHLIITIFFVLLLLPFVSDKVIFIVVALIASYIPDIDIKSSKAGRKKIFRIPQLFLRHRGILHSFSFLFILTFIFVIFIPKIYLGFFVGYFLHLFFDGITKEGIRPFYPSKKRFSGRVKVGGRMEVFIFVMFLIGSLVLVSKYIFF